MKRLLLFSVSTLITFSCFAYTPAKKPANVAQLEERIKKLEEQAGKKGGAPTAPQTMTCKAFNGCTQVWHSASGANEAEARKAVMQKCNMPPKVGGRAIKPLRKQCCGLPQCTKLPQKTEL